MAKLAKGVLVLGFASATLATPESSCKSPAAPTSATYATRLSQFNRKSGVTDFAVRFDKVESASGYRLCWDIQGRGKFDSNTWKISATCIDLEGGDNTEYNNGERVFAAPRVVNKFKNVRVAARSACGTLSPYTPAKLDATATPFLCKDGQNDDNYATTVQLENVAVSDKRIATGTVFWAYPKGIPKRATYEVCIAQDKGPYGATQNRMCFISEPGASSYEFSVPLGSAVGQIHAEVRQAVACTADMDTSDNVAVPQLYVPFGAHLTNGMSVCLVETGTKGRLKYGACDSDRVVKVKAVLSESGDYTGVYRTKKGQCVVVRGTSVRLGTCPRVDSVGNTDDGWDPYRKTSSRATVARQYIRDFGSGMCLPIGKDVAKMGATPRLKPCNELMFS